MADGLYYVGIRPEDFKVEENGLSVNILDIDHIGRDTLIRFSIKDVTIRAVVESDSIEGVTEIKLAVKPNKIHMFDKVSGEVIK